MKKNYFIKKPKRLFIAFIVLFCGLFANTAMAQTNYVWNGPAGGDWATTTNWTPNGIPGGNSGDTVTISNGGTPSIASPNSYTILNLTINNLTGGDAGSILTINSGATLTVNNTAVNAITLNGGSIVNNGTLNANTTDITAAFGILCGAPTTLPTVASQYGYSGTGKLSINTSSGTASSGAINFTGNTANTTYKFSFDNTSIITPSTFTLASGAYVIRVPGGNTIPVTIGGAGFSTAGSWGLIAMGGGGINLTVDIGTTLSSNLTGTAPRGIDIQNTNTTQPATLTNKGTINITGTTATQSGIFISTATSTSGNATITLANEGTIDVDITCPTAVQSPLRIQGTGSLTSRGIVKITNSAGAIMKLKNNQAFGNNLGNPIYINTTNSTTPTITFTNNGSLSFTGNNVVFGGSNIRATLTNNGTITSNQQFSTIKLLNNSGKTIAFVKDASTIASPNALTTILVFATNNGIIQTATGSDKLYNLAGVTAYGANSSIEPGGSTGKGIADFSKAAVTLSGKYILQVAGNSAAGTDYDQIQNTLATGSFTLSGATLDVTGIYTPGGSVTIDIVTASTVLGSEGTITNQFSSVIGLTSGWSVNYISGTAGSVTGKVQLVYSAISPTATTWTGGTDTDWTIAGNWSAGVPDQNSDVTIGTGTFQPTIATNVNINSLTINSGASLSVTAKNLTVTGAITNNGGSMTLANNVNLIQGGTTNTNTGNITVNRNSDALINLDFTSWSSPVTGSQTLAGFSPGTSQSPSRFFNYNETTNAYSFIASPTTTTFATGQGYLIRVPFAHPLTLTIWSGSFSGVPNNGTINKAITYLDATHGYNMLGNPYPSTIDAQAFIAANTANIESSLYFWRKTNGASGSSYAVYNPMGSTIATPSSELPNGTIQVGQGFFVKAKSASSVNFTNAMRVANNVDQFFKTKAVQKDRLWLSLNNAAGAYSQTLVGYTADATLGVDMYDAKYINDSPVALTTDIASEEYSIQGRPTFDPTDIVALNFKTDVAGDYTIALDQFDGAFASGQDVYLLDNNTGAETNLKLGSYTFNAPAGTDNSRFTVKYQKTLKVGENDFNENSVSVYKNNGTIYVNSGEVTISNIKVFDIQGRLVAEQKNVKSTVASINNLKSTNQVLIVKVSGENNKVVTKKVLN